MKRILTVLTLLSALLLASCTSTQNGDVIFIHAIGFDENDTGITVSAIMESTADSQDDRKQQESSGQSSQQSDSGTLFISTGTGKNIKDAFSDLLNGTDKSCFGTSETYYFGENLSRSAMKEIASYLPSQPAFPLKCGVVCVSGTSVKNLFSRINSMQSLEEMNKLTKADSVNVMHFFGSIAQKGQLIAIPSLTYSGKVTRISDTIYQSFAAVRASKAASL